MKSLIVRFYHMKGIDLRIHKRQYREDRNCVACVVICKAYRRIIAASVYIMVIRDT